MITGSNYNRRMLRQEMNAAFHNDTPVILDKVFSVAIGATMVLLVAALSIQGLSR